MQNLLRAGLVTIAFSMVSYGADWASPWYFRTRPKPVISEENTPVEKRAAARRMSSPKLKPVVKQESSSFRPFFLLYTRTPNPSRSDSRSGTASTAR